jgi:hypothetical protein
MHVAKVDPAVAACPGCGVVSSSGKQKVVTRLEPVELLGTISRAVLDNLLTPCRPRYSARKVKSATSRYLNCDDSHAHQTTTITTVEVVVHTPPIDQGPKRTLRLFMNSHTRQAARRSGRRTPMRRRPLAGRHIDALAASP